MKKKLHGLKISKLELKHKMYIMHPVCSGLHMQLSFIALHGNAESVLKSCLTLRGLGDNNKLLSPF